jgi:hypothetical protein
MQLQRMMPHRSLPTEGAGSGLIEGPGVLELSRLRGRDSQGWCFECIRLRVRKILESGLPSLDSDCRPIWGSCILFCAIPSVQASDSVTRPVSCGALVASPVNVQNCYCLRSYIGHVFPVFFAQALRLGHISNRFRKRIHQGIASLKD